MKIYYDKNIRKYSGEELQSLWAYKNFNIQGDSCISFIGSCDIKDEFMVDIEDLKNKQKIYSELMVHFIIEHFEMDLEKSILRQRIFVSIVEKELRQKAKGINNLFRKGNDLFDNDAKLSISIATLTPVSTIIHFGINISGKNTPVKTKGLNDYDIIADNFIVNVMEDYKKEMESINMSRCKVKGVK